MSENLLNGLYIIPILAVLIILHEIGHFVTARMVGVKVEEFGIGIPPRLFGWTRRGVIWSINAIPFGGFVRVLGEDGKSMEPGSMNAKSPGQRAFFLTAGSGMNFLTAIVLMIAVVGIQGISHTNVYIGGVQGGSPAARAGWQAGDQIVQVAGSTIDGSEELTRSVREFAGRPMSVVIERRGKEIETTVTPRADPPQGQGPTGVNLEAVAEADITIESVVAGSPAATAGLQAGDRIVSVNQRPVADRYGFTFELQRFAGFEVPIVVDRAGANQDLTIAVPKDQANQSILTEVGLAAQVEPRYERVPAAQVLPRGLSESWQMTTGFVAGIRELFSSRENLRQVAGPIGMGQLTSEVLSESPLPRWVNLANLTIILSLNLAVLNLLPLPALDGGRLFFVIIEILRGGRRIAPEKEGVVHLVGLVLLLGLMFFIAVLDVNRLFDNRSFLP